MKQNTLLIAAAAIVAYFLYRNSQKKSAALTPDMPPVSLEEPNVDLIKSQTVNFPQIAPTPSTIMDMPGSPNNIDYGCSNCGRESTKQLGALPYIC